jgi:ADP-ribose pyrophosphatase YjhB (NUDIX family)
MNNYCINCGKSGHNSKQCIEPIISCGILCFKIDNFSLNKIDKFLFNKYINIENYNYSNFNYFNKVNFHNNNIKFLLIQRKHSLSYIEFLRGQYNEYDNEKISNMFKLMSFNEVEDIKNNNFEYLWDKLWKKTSRSKNFQKEMLVSKNKFQFLKNNNIINDLKSEYSCPEWGFPKGRRNKFENNYECANREFIEETNLINYYKFDRIENIEETFMGTNEIKYKHIYYIAGSTEENLSFSNDNDEIGNIGWFTKDEVLKLLRPYHNSKKNLINQLYFFLSIIIHKIKNKSIVITNQSC